MPDVYEIEVGGQVYEVEANSIEQASKAAEQFVSQAKPQRRDMGTESYPRMELVRPEHFNLSTPEGWINSALGLASGVALGGGPIAVAKNLGMSMLGTAAGGASGRAVGSGLEAAGFPSGTSRTLGIAGGLFGSVVTPMGGPAALLRLRAAGGGAGGAISSLLERMLAKETGKTAVRSGAAKAAERAAAQRAARAAAQRAAAERAVAERAVAERAVAERAASAAEVTEEAPQIAKTILKRGERAMGTNLGGTAKPGPAPTAEGDLEAALRASLKPQSGVVKPQGGVVKMEPTRTLAEAEERQVAKEIVSRVDDQFLNFVKKEGPKFKMGERVWFIRDASGNPVQTFESGAQAQGWIRRAANRDKGFTVDFFQNLWAS